MRILPSPAGKRHPLVAILALSCAAALCGASGLTAISQWGRDHSREVLARLGCTHFPGPSAATLCRVFSQLYVAALEKALTQWWQSWLPGLGPLALDGKTVRGSRQGSQEAVQLLVVFATQVRVVLAQRAISHGDEISTASCGASCCITWMNSTLRLPPSTNASPSTLRHTRR